MPTYYNLVRMYTTTTGDSDVTLTTAVPGCKTFAEAGVADSEEVNYGLITYNTITHRPVGSETGLGKYIASGTVFKRTTVENSTDSDNSAVDLTGLTEIYIGPSSSYYNTGFIDKNKFASYNSSTFDSVADSGTQNALSITLEQVDQGGIGSLAANTVKIADSGWYYVSAQVYVADVAYTTPLNGRVELDVVKNGATSVGYVVKGYSTGEGITYDIINVMSQSLQIADSDEFTIKLSNFLGLTVEAYVHDLTFVKLGDL